MESGPARGPGNDPAPDRGAEADSPPPSGHPYALHIGLFLATCFTTTWIGVLNWHEKISWMDLPRILPLLPDGLPYSLSIMAILLTHEMGHFLLARRCGVAASLPYFLPVPLPPVGTLGAVIRMEGRIRSRNALLDIGAAGPLAGLAVALPVLAYGLHLSPIIPLKEAVLEGNSVLYLLLKLLVKGAILPGGGQDVHLHPMAWAGWVGLLVTMLNLMPIGQLDGGHIAHAYFGPRHNTLSVWLHRGLLTMAVLASGYTVYELSRRAPLLRALGLGWSAGLPWVVWWLLLMLMKRISGGQYHPPVGETPLSGGRRVLALFMLVLFVFILVPIPLRPTL